MNFLTCRILTRTPLILAATMLVMTSCGKYKSEAVGRARDVIVFTEHKDLVETGADFALERQIFTPQPAPEFFLRFMQPEEIEKYAGYHALFFAGFDSDPLMKRLFPNLSARDSFALYQITDVWAKEQEVLVYLARDSASLKHGLEVMKEKIYEAFKFHLLERMETVTYEDGGDAKLTAKIGTYGFGLKVPRDWLLDETFAAERFVWIHAHNPERLVFIYWENAPRADIAADKMKALRDSLTWMFYQKDYLNDTFTIAGPAYFRGNEAARIRGVWQNDSMTIGGPMISYSFNEGGKFYMIDGTLFYPETPRKKLFWLNQLEVVLATFKPGK